jgi:hypothetical protein
MRVPSEGQSFSLLDVDFEVKSVSGTRIKSITTDKNIDINKILKIKKGATFEIFGTKFIVDGFRFSNNKGTFYSRVA